VPSLLGAKTLLHPFDPCNLLLRSFEKSTPILCAVRKRSEAGKQGALAPAGILVLNLRGLREPHAQSLASRRNAGKTLRYRNKEHSAASARWPHSDGTLNFPSTDERSAKPRARCAANHYASMAFTTRPCTSVNRNCRP
jgi:hypothetical protein